MYALYACFFFFMLFLCKLHFPQYGNDALPGSIPDFQAWYEMKLTCFFGGLDLLWVIIVIQIIISNNNTKNLQY